MCELWLEVGRGIAIVTVAALPLGTMALAVYLALFSAPEREAGWHHRWLYRWGQALIVAGPLLALAFLLGLAVTLGVRLASP